VTITLRPHQLAAADAVENAFRAGINRPLIDMCVAAGKSYTYAELARRAWSRGERTIIAAHRSELVEQNAEACRKLGLTVGINSATLDQRTWRAPVISCQIQSVANNAQSFGPIGLLCGDEAHLWPHSESGQFRALHRGLGFPRLVGGSGTPFRLLGGSLTEGEAAPFDRTVFRYSIIDGIRDGYLVPPFTEPVGDKIDATKLRVRQGEYTGASSDPQMIESIDNHIAQMVHYGANRRSWLVFEASTKAAIAMAARMNEWGIPTGLVLGSKSKADDIARRRVTEQLRSGQLRAIVNLDCLTTGFDVQEIDMLVCRRPTKSLSLWIQIVGRLLRTINGDIQSSIAAGKEDGLLLDFSGNLETFGPLDFIRPKETRSPMVSCSECGKRNASAAARCWSCDAVMTKLCPACLVEIRKGELDCSHCGHDMRVERSEAAAPKLFELPSGAALISSFSKNQDRTGGWIAVKKCFSEDGTVTVDTDSQRVTLPEILTPFAEKIKWIRVEPLAVLIPNGASRTSALQINSDGASVVVPMPGVSLSAT
jgi:DNA repair protein RadD